MRTAIRPIILVFQLFSTILPSAKGMAASIEETFDKLNRLPLSERQSALEREARKEGRIVFYTTLNVADLQDIKKLFEQKYPFLRLEPFRLGHGRLANKIQTEALAGKLEADAVSIPGNYVSEFRANGVLARIELRSGTSSGKVLPTKRAGSTACTAPRIRSSTIPS